MDTTPAREEALALLKRYTKTESLINHALCVEATLRRFARRFGEDQERWGIIGLVHDLDWEMYPEEHCTRTREILTKEGWPERDIRAVMSHAWGMFTDVEPQERMEKVLFAIDELTGLVTATALVRPSRSVLDVKVSSVKKKWKEKSFAAGANRDIIQKGIDMLGLDRDDVIGETIEAMKTIAHDIGLAGTSGEA